MFVKLFREILMSSIWDEDADTRLLWITMLVLADQDGYVRGTPSALARTARLNVDAAQKALDVLAAPDPQSRTPDNDGRRIEPAPGGWMVLNYQAYREARSAEDRRTYMRNYMRDYRGGKQSVNTCKQSVNTPLAPLAQAEAEAEAEAESACKASCTLSSPSCTPADAATAEAAEIIAEKRTLTDLISTGSKQQAFTAVAAGILRKHGEDLLRRALARVSEEWIAKRGRGEKIKNPAGYLMQTATNLAEGQ